MEPLTAKEKRRFEEWIIANGFKVFMAQELGQKEHIGDKLRDI